MALIVECHFSSSYLLRRVISDIDDVGGCARGRGPLPVMRPQIQCTTNKLLMYQHFLLVLYIIVLCTPGLLGSTNRVAVQEQGLNRCNRINYCWQCIKTPLCAWCTDGTEDGTCIFESERMLMCDGMKDTYIEKGYGCPNSVLDGGSAGPKREHGFGTSNRTESLKTFFLRTKNVHEVTAKSKARDALLKGINDANNIKITEAAGR